MTRRIRVLLRLLVAGLCLPLLAASDGRLLDDFEDVSLWSAASYPGATLEIASDAGRDGQPAMRLDFDLNGARGYVLASRPLRAELPENWVITFWMRAAAPMNTLEFKLVDASGRNVWWRRQPDFRFPLGWTRVTIRKSQLEFAWGPDPAAELRGISALEIAVTAGSGGRGSVWIDDLRLEKREPTDLRALRPRVRASNGSGADAVFDGDPATAWRAAAGPQAEWLELDFRRAVAFGGVAIDWGRDAAAAFRVLVSDDGERYVAVHTANDAGGSRSYVQLPAEEARFLRLELLRSRGAGYAVREIRLEPPVFAESSNRLFEAVARDAPRGSYPRYLLGEQAYWTVFGVEAGAHKALLDEDGRLEVATGRFTLEPFLRAGGEFTTWADVEADQELAEGSLPIPSVQWRRRDLLLRITAFAARGPAGETLYARYRVENTGAEALPATLFVALRPFQVNPPWQSLNRAGGAARVEHIERRGRAISVDHAETVVALSPPTAFGALAFERGSLVETLRDGALPADEMVTDPLGHASGALRFDLALPAGGARDVWLAVAFDADPEGSQLAREDPERAQARLEETTRSWRERLARIDIRLPPAGQPLLQTLRSSVAYILVNRSGPAIQPGPRAYARSWIRDGALTSAALLEMGYPEPVRDFLRWYARYQYDDGRIPCCVDERGPDPVAEHDSTGEFIYAITNYYRNTRDRAFLEELWPRVVRAVAYIRFLRDQTRTSAYEGPDALPAWGLAPPSISHEGYSANPVHSYWDDFFLLRGLKDSVIIAGELGDEEHAASFATLRDEFQADLYASIARAVARHEIDFIPGSVELGDFDPTSTSIAISPGGELDNLPKAELERTFERYFAHFLERRYGAIEWQSYTPYELRNVGTLIRLGRRDLALEALYFFLGDRRPAGWNQWAEVVWRDPRAPRFIGDMPHTWVGSGFLRSVRSLFVYEREADEALVLGAGLPRAWIDTPPGVRVERLSTHYGPIGYSARADGPGRVVFEIRGDVHSPLGYTVVTSPYEEPLVGVRVDGREVTDFAPDSVAIHGLPSEVVLRYAAE